MRWLREKRGKSKKVEKRSEELDTPLMSHQCTWLVSGRIAQVVQNREIRIYEDLIIHSKVVNVYSVMYMVLFRTIRQGVDE